MLRRRCGSTLKLQLIKVAYKLRTQLPINLPFKSILTINRLIAGI